MSERSVCDVRTYIAKRIGISVIILFCVTFIIYGLMRALPSSYVETMAMQLSQAPGAKPYADVGQRVKAGDTVCIIEAMKLLNEIEAETDGVIQEILVDNGAPVEFGQPLFVIA